MSPEITTSIEDQKKEQMELFKIMAPRVSDLIEFDISDELLNKINDSINENRLVVFVGNHQSYFETEVWALISKRLSRMSPKFDGIYLTYSEPATNSNVGEFLEKRNQYYIENKLYLLPVIREIDRTDPRYKDLITPEMEERNSISRSKLAHARKTNRAIVALPEGHLTGGRINQETGKIFGIQKAMDKTFLNIVFKENNIEDEEESRFKKIVKTTKTKFSRLIHKTVLVPIGIDGSYKVLSSEPNNYKFSKKIPLFLKNKEKPVTVRAKKIIPATEYTSLDGNVVEIIMDIEVAPLVSFDAQGIHQRTLNRTDLESVV